MAISTEEIVRQLTAFFPDRIIYKQEFSYKYIGYALDRAIRSAFKAENVSRAQWLRDHGFDWRETGYIEKDMRSDPAVAIDGTSAFSLGKSAVYRYPLLGEYEPSPAEMEMLMKAAQDVFRKMTLERAELIFEEQAVPKRPLKVRQINIKCSSDRKGLLPVNYTGSRPFALP